MGRTFIHGLCIYAYITNHALKPIFYIYVYLGFCLFSNFNKLMDSVSSANLTVGLARLIVVGRGWGGGCRPPPHPFNFTPDPTHRCLCVVCVTKLFCYTGVYKKRGEMERRARSNLDRHHQQVHMYM